MLFSTHPRSPRSFSRSSSQISFLALFLFLLSVGVVSASTFFNEQPTDPSRAVLDQVSVMFQIIIPLMLVMVVIAGAVYAVGQMFGAETRARATVWAHGLIIAVGISALIILAIYVLLPRFFTAQAGQDVSNFDTVSAISDLRNATSALLAAVAIVLPVLAGAIYAIGMMFGAETRARAHNWASALIAAALLAAILYILLSTILPQLGDAILGGTSLGLYSGVVIDVVFFVSCFIFLTYIVSRIFRVPEWEAYLNIEFSNLITSFLLVIFILGLFAVGTIVVLQMSGGSYTSPPQAAIAYMQGTVMDSALRASIDVFKIQACTSILSTFARRIGEFVLTQAYKVFPGMDTFVSITNTLSFALISLYNTATVQVTLLYVVDALMVPFFLPAGLILRFFPPTRDAGAFLISLAFGLQIVYPMTYLLNKQIYEEVGAKPYNAPGERPVMLIQSICGPFKYGVAGFLFNTQANPIFSLIPGGRAVGDALARVVSESLLNAISMAEFVPIMQHVAALSLLTLFMPALSMMVTIAFVNAMTKFIVAKV